MSPSLSSRAGRWPGFPRVSGDEPLSRVNCMAACMFSPRERG